MIRETDLFKGLMVALLLTINGVAGAQSAASTIYRLNQQSSYEQGCFAPCECPITQPTEVRGTFVLTPQGETNSIAAYQVTGVNWIFTMGSQQVLATGSGTYENGGNPAQQRLQLDLMVGNQPLHFDSGWVPAQASFPDIVVTISLHGERCYDQVFSVNASPASQAEIHPYQLVSGSNFQQGCVPPCACAMGPRRPLSGTFALVDLPPTPLFSEFALVNVDWLAAQMGSLRRAPAAPTPVAGTGFYRLGGEVAAQQELTLRLSVGGGTPSDFDSGLLTTQVSFPLINAHVSTHGTRCAATMMEIKAAPQN